MATGEGSAYTLDGGATWTVIDESLHFGPIFISPETGWVGSAVEPLIYKWFISPQAAIGSYPPAMQNFGPTSAGSQSNAKTIYLSNYGREPLIISEIIQPGALFSISDSFALPLQLKYLETARVAVTFTPNAGGTARDSIVVISNAANAPRHTITLEGRGMVLERAQPNVLYAIAVTSLYKLDPVTAQGTREASMTLANVRSLIIHPKTRELVAVLSTAAKSDFFSVCAMTGKAELLWSITVGNLRGLAYRGESLYAVSAEGHLYRIDTEISKALLIGQVRGGAYCGLAAHPVTGDLYAAIRATSGEDQDRIVTVNPGNGDTTLVGAIGFTERTFALTFSPSGVLYGCKDSNIPSLFTIDLQTGAGTVIGPIGLSRLTALAWSPAVTPVAEQAEPDVAPDNFALMQNYPNPFNHETVISFSLPHPEKVTIKIYDILGRETVLLTNETHPAGIHHISFDANTLSGGIYLYRMTAGNYSSVKKFAIIK